MEAKATKISLTQQEAKLSRVLLEVAHCVDESKKTKQRLELRFAGGWVRDKLLGIPSNDIDIAINVMTGYEFALEMKEYVASTEHLMRLDIEPKDVGNLHKIAANPDKSKHLETATVKILGFDIDFVNLRKETYSSDSRTPQMQFGTAREDALRRDATINALFYNLHTNEVEDFAGGLSDMQSKLIRTPLEPHQTFMDDPLRVLRLIRFASRLNFTIDASSEVAMQDVEVRHALKLKISRERVGTEFSKMLKAQNPKSALDMFNRLELYAIIFTDPTAERIPEPCTRRWHCAYDCLDVLSNNESPKSIYQVLVRTDKELAWLLASLAPWFDTKDLPPSKTGRTSLPYAARVAREGIKQSNRVCDFVTGAFRHFEEIIKFKDAIVTRQAFTRQPDVLGMAIRRWDEQGGQWRIQVVLAILVEAMTSDVSAGYDTIFQGWQNFLDRLEEMGVMDAPHRKRLVDGKQLATALNAKPGVWMKPAIDMCMAWQFRNPRAIDPTGAIVEVKSRAGELQIPVSS
ncbi:MAG: CCA tRNA nucleotidyltransferase, mitochondrial [Claussenomyces sp. TS43310]|nr:MAG: CCA tRNA nucleotidyltransferase, mitochondrial [Claussenomyces sp. TS43310]